MEALNAGAVGWIQVWQLQIGDYRREALLT